MVGGLVREGQRLRCRQLGHHVLFSSARLRCSRIAQRISELSDLSASATRRSSSRRCSRLTWALTIVVDGPLVVVIPKGLEHDLVSAETPSRSLTNERGELQREPEQKKQKSHVSQEDIR